MKSAWHYLVATLFLIGCTPSDEQSFRGSASKANGGDAAAADCDKPELYGEDCSGHHPDEVADLPAPKTEEVQADEPAAEEPPADEQAEAPPAQPPQDPNVVEFRIAAGTGQAGWNTQATMVNVKIGQTLKIFNDDNVNHRMHTGGDPCPHGQNIPPGGMAECVIASAIDPGANMPRTYDHNYGQQAAPFFVKAVP